jgi:hypothetical protein
MSLKIIRNLAVMLLLGVGGIYAVNAETNEAGLFNKAKCTCTAPPNCSCTCSTDGTGCSCGPLC